MLSDPTCRRRLDRQIQGQRVEGDRQPGGRGSGDQRLPGAELPFGKMKKFRRKMAETVTQQCDPAECHRPFTEHG